MSDEVEEEIDLLKWKPGIECPNGVLTVWGSVVVTKDANIEEFFIEKFNGVELIPVGCVLTLPEAEHRHMEEPPTGGRCDFFFFVEGQYIPKFAVPRLEYGMRWAYGVNHDIYPLEF